MNTRNEIGQFAKQQLRCLGLTILFLVWGLSGYTQVNKLSSWNKSSAPFVDKDKGLAYSFTTSPSGVAYFTETRLSDGTQTSTQISQDFSFYNISYTSNGFFFFRGTYNSNSALIDTLCFFSFQTKTFTRLKAISYRQTTNTIPFYKVLGVSGDKIYFNGRNKDGTYSLWVSDGSLANSVQLSTFENSIGQWRSGKDAFWFTLKENNTNYLKVLEGGNISTVVSFPANEKNVYIGTQYSDSIVFLNVYDQVDSSWQLWKSDFESAVFLSNISFSIDDAWISDDRSSLKAVDRGRIITYSLSQSSIISQTPVPFDFTYRLSGSLVNLDKNVFYALSDKYGSEVAFVTENDSVAVADLNIGCFSGIALNSYGYNPKFMARPDGNNMDSVFVVSRTGEHQMYALILVVNRNNSLSYYKIADLNSIEDIGSLYQSFMYENKFHFITKNDKLSNYVLYSVDINNPVLWNNDITLDSSETWHRQIGFGATISNPPQYRLSELSIDQNDAVIVSVNIQNMHAVIQNDGIYKNPKPLKQYDTHYEGEIRTSQFAVKLSKNGGVKWISSFGNTTDGVYPALHQTIDGNGDVYVVGMAWEKAIFGLDTVYRNGSFAYLVKLDGVTGNILFYKILFESYYLDDNIEAIVSDKQNNIYIAFMYEHFDVVFCGQLLRNTQVSPANALAKMDESGNVKWVKNMITPFTNNFGKTRDICIDENGKRIYVLQSVGSFNWESSCRYSTWDTYIQCLNWDGDLTWGKWIVGSDLHSARSLGITPGGLLQVMGYFRGEITFDHVELKSAPNNGCSNFQNFSARISLDNGFVYQAKTSNQNLFLPDRTVQEENGTKLSIGYQPFGTRSHHLQLTRFNDKGDIIGARDLKKTGDPFDFDYFPSIATRNGYVVVADIAQYEFDTFKNILEGSYNISIARYNIERSMEPMAVTKEVSTYKYLLNIRPNPTSDYVLLTRDVDADIERIEMIGVDGKVVGVPAMETMDEYIQLDLRTYPQGMYFMTIYGSKGPEAVKILRY